jgi:hypothetical protein
MALTLNLSAELEQRLLQEADRRGIAPETFTLLLLEKSLPPENRRQEIVRLLDEWMTDEDAQEQQETGDYLIRSLDEDRLGDRPLFPSDLQGVTW